jgi:hypothetical protein
MFATIHNRLRWLLLVLHRQQQRPLAATAAALAYGLGAVVAVAVAPRPAVAHADAGSSPGFVGAIGACTATTGSVVAVDFGPWVGPVALGCDMSNPAHGINLLHDTGFTTEGDEHDGPAFICRIGSGLYNGGAQAPTQSQDACIVTPPATAYWSYWLAPEGQGSWTYSPLGACSDVPEPGEVEAWVYGATNIAGTTGLPTFTPDQVRALESVSGSGSGTTGGTSSGCVNSGTTPTTTSTTTTPATTPSLTQPTSTPTATTTSPTSTSTSTSTSTTPAAT